MRQYSRILLLLGYKLFLTARKQKHVSVARQSALVTLTFARVSFDETNPSLRTEVTSLKLRTRGTAFGYRGRFLATHPRIEVDEDDDDEVKEEEEDEEETGGYTRRATRAYKHSRHEIR